MYSFLVKCRSNVIKAVMNYNLAYQIYIVRNVPHKMENQRANSKEYNLSKDAAVLFLNNKLHINDVQKNFETNKRCLLDIIANKWMQTIPFQNLKLLATDTSQRGIPSVKHAINDTLSGTGGMCYSHSIAAYHVLKAIGYECYLVICAVQGEKNHSALMVKNVETQDDLFLFDVGLSFPTFRAIQLKSRYGYIEETETRTESLCTYKFVKRGNTYLRYNKTSKIDIEGEWNYIKIGDTTWCELVRIWIEPVTFEAIQDILDRNVYTNMDFFMHSTIFVTKYPGNRFVSVKHDNLLKEDNEGGKLQSTECKDLAQFELYIWEHFPEIPHDIIKKAYEFFIKV